MVDTIKFSQMTDGGDLANNEKVPGLLAGGNVLYNNPWTFLAPGTTAERPIPSSAINYRLRFNTDNQLYEYYDAVLGQWITIQESAFTTGPYITYTADASLPDAQNLGLLVSGILKQTVSLGSATLNIAGNGTDYYGPGFTGSYNAPDGITDLIGNAVVGFVYNPNSVNYINIVNAATNFNPYLTSVGTDTNIGFYIITKGTGQVVLQAANTTMPLVINSGTAYQHTTIFEFANTSESRTVTFQDSSGTVAYLSDVAGDVTSAQGTASQVAVNSTTGIPQTGAIVLSLPQNIDINSAVAFGSLTLVTPMVPSSGGTGVNNGSNTLTLAGNLATSGAFASTFTMTGATNVTFPTSGTLATTSQLPSGAALTKTDDTNVTLTLGGTPATALLQATSLTLGWTGQLSLTRGGTAASLTASNGGIVYSNASTLAILAGTATATQMLQSGLSSSPAWSTTTWPATSTINQILYSSAANTITGLATANSAVLITSAGGVPSLSTTLPSGISATNMNLTTPTLGAASATSINFGQTSLSNYQEGTWTPIDASGASLTFTSVSGNYTRIGRMVIALCSLTYPSTANASSALIGGLPFTSNASAGSVGGSVTFTNAATLNKCLITTSATTFGLYTAAGANLTNANMSASVSYFQLVYFV